MGKCPRIYKPRGRGKVVDVGTCRAQKARHRTSSPETRPSPPPHSPLRPLKRRHRRRIIQSHIFIGGGYGGLQLRVPCGAICLIALFVASSDQESNQETGASKQLAPHSRKRNCKPL